MDAQVFISHSSKDRKMAQTICGALENRGFTCWISSRNVGGGENFQEAIVRAIRNAKVMVLVFTANANNSDEIKKELVVAGKYGLVVIPARVEDVVPNDAFMYEFATRQWIDMFEDWERAIDGLSSQIAGTLQAPRASAAVAESPPKRSTSGVRPRPPDPRDAGRSVGAAARPKTAERPVPPRSAREAPAASSAALAGKPSPDVQSKGKPDHAAAGTPEAKSDAPGKSSAFSALSGVGAGRLANARVIAAVALVVVGVAIFLGVKSFTGSALVAPPKALVLAPLTADQERTLKPNDSFQECFACPLMMTIPAGTFMMGSDTSESEREGTESPVHQVTLKRFAAGKYAVTFDEWEACFRDNGCDYKPTIWGGGRQPVVNVTWYDARAYVKWLSAKSKVMKYRLLTEAEREYVTRAGTTTPFWWGRSISAADANYNGEPYAGAAAGHAEVSGRTMPVQSFKPNAFGLHQVHGNVWEWVEDCWSDSYQRAPADGTAAPGSCSVRVLRGGSWNDDPKRLRSASRTSYDPDRHLNTMGFRVARTLTQ